MTHVWLKSYPSGVPATVDVDAYRSIVEVFDTSVARFAGRPAYAHMGTVLSYAELDRLTRDVAAFLQKGLRLSRGERIALMMPNLLQYPIMVFGALRAGLTIVNTNPLYKPRELRHQLADSGATAIVVLENFAHTLEQVLADTSIRHVIVTGLGDALPGIKGTATNLIVRHVKRMVPPYRLPGSLRFRDMIDQGAKLDATPVELTHRDVAFLQYTGGTTGIAKGAMLTHGNMVANLQQAHAWLAPFLEEGSEVVVSALPFYHVFALLVNCLVFMKIGGKNLLITNPRDLKGFVRELHRNRFTVLPGVNTLFNALLNTPGFSQLDFSQLKLALGGGMAVQRPVADRWKAVTGTTLVEAYGLTEASPGVCINPLDLAEFNDRIGVPLPSTECIILDAEGRPAAIGEAGELCVRGPQVMAGYWQRPEDTAQVLTPDGWLRTGDIARMHPDGFIELVDRKKDLIMVSGFKVFPNEVEEVVATHPGVLEVAAVGVPDAHSGEVVKIVVVRREPNVTAEELVAHCRRNLTGYKVPRVVEFRDELPKSNVGKILRRELRETRPAEVVH